MFENVFQGIYIGGLYAPNRIVFPAMDLELWGDGPTKPLLELYRRVAEGGAAIVFTGPAYPHISGKPGPRTPGLDSDASIEMFRKVSKAVREGGGIPGIQLLHAGRYAGRSVTKGLGPVAPSPVPSPILFKETPRALSEDEIWILIRAYGDAAERAVKAGYSVVEIHGGMGYLPAQFLSPLTNRRRDSWGGDLRRRARFLLEVVKAVVARVRAPVLVRYSLLDFLKGGLSLGDSVRVLRWAVDLGLAGVNIVFGWHESPVPLISREVPPGGFAKYCRGLREALGVPVIYGTRVTDLEVAEKILAGGLADMVAMGRALIADPLLPTKQMRGLRPRPCLACSHCLSSIFMGRSVSCVVNPSILNPADVGRAPRPLRVAVVGGGPSGMEVARVAALRGHSVTLFEKCGELGGMLRYAAMEPFGEEFGRLARYYEEELERLGVEVRLGRDAGVDDVREFDKVFLATGPRLDVSWVPEGVEVRPWWKGFVEPMYGEVAVVGSNVVGVGLADYLSSIGRRVTVIDWERRAGRGLEKVTRWIVLGRLRRAGVKFVLGVDIRSGVVQRSLLEGFDAVYAAARFRPRLLGEWGRLGEKVVMVGNALNPSMDAMLMQAIHSAYHLALLHL